MVHNLIKNPNDLPINSDNVLAMVVYGENWCESVIAYYRECLPRYGCEWEGIWYNSHTKEPLSCVIKWKEIDWDDD